MYIIQHFSNRIYCQVLCLRRFSIIYFVFAVLLGVKLLSISCIIDNVQIHNNVKKSFCTTLDSVCNIVKAIIAWNISYWVRLSYRNISWYQSRKGTFGWLTYLILQRYLMLNKVMLFIDWNFNLDFQEFSIYYGCGFILVTAFFFNSFILEFNGIYTLLDLINITNVNFGMLRCLLLIHA